MIPDEHQEVLDKVRRARVEAAARRGRDPRDHPDAVHLAPDDIDAMLDVYDWARQRGLGGGYPDTAGRAREKARRRVEVAARQGRRMPSGDFPASDLAHFTDEELLELLRTRDVFRRNNAESQRRRAERRAVAAEVRRLERERASRETGDLEAEARERLGL